MDDISATSASATCLLSTANASSLDQLKACCEVVRQKIVGAFDVGRVSAGNVFAVKPGPTPYSYSHCVEQLYHHFPFIH